MDWIKGSVWNSQEVTNYDRQKGTIAEMLWLWQWNNEGNNPSKLMSHIFKFKYFKIHNYRKHMYFSNSLCGNCCLAKQTLRWVESSVFTIISQKGIKHILNILILHSQLEIKFFRIRLRFVNINSFRYILIQEIKMENDLQPFMQDNLTYKTI